MFFFLIIISGSDYDGVTMTNRIIIFFRNSPKLSTSDHCFHKH